MTAFKWPSVFLEDCRNKAAPKVQNQSLAPLSNIAHFLKCFEEFIAGV
jgi:hypothetical protein